MISTILAMVAMEQTSRPSFTMILVAGNDIPILEPKTLTDQTSDSMILALQRLVQKFDASKAPWAIIDGTSLATQKGSHDQTRLTTICCKYESYVSASEDVTIRGKTKRTFEETTSSKLVDSSSVTQCFHDGTSIFFTNLAEGPDKNNLMLTNLSALPRIEKERQKDYINFLRHSVAVSDLSIWETEDWLNAYLGEHRPTMVLCASGRPQDGHRDLLAFPPEGVILTYQVTFDKRWSAELKDIIRVQ